MKDLLQEHCHIYVADALQLPESIHELFALLSEQEQVQVKRLRFERDQRLVLCAHLLKRSVLAIHCGQMAHSLRFGHTSLGKPYLVDYPNWQFNLSHSQNTAVLALRQHTPIGVDIEVPKTSLDPLRLARRYFQSSEIDLIMGCPSAAQAKLFYRLWVAKESILKAQGVGIAHHLADVELALENDRLSIKRLPLEFGDVTQWYLHELDVDKALFAAVSSPKPIDQIKLFDANFSGIMKNHLVLTPI